MVGVWATFVDLHNSRSVGFSANPIAYSEILAYYTLHQIVPDLWEVQTIKRLDNVVLEIAAIEQEKQAKKNAAPRR